MTVYLAHATSFCAGVWRPVVDRLEGIHCVAWDFPGHGAGPPLRPPFSWEVFGIHALEMTEPGGVGVGHSMGAAALAMAEIADPGRFRFLVLIEPIIFPGLMVAKSTRSAWWPPSARTAFPAGNRHGRASLPGRPSPDGTVMPSPDMSSAA